MLSRSLAEIYICFMIRSSPRFEDILATFSLLDDWEDRYRYLIELGRDLESLPPGARTEENKVPGCASQVWLQTRREGERLYFLGDSDAHIVKGLIALLFSLYSGRPARDILAIDAVKALQTLGLEQHLSPQRSNGLKAMAERIRRDAAKACAG